jgi:hypothetical protein
MINSVRISMKNFDTSVPVQIAKKQKIKFLCSLNLEFTEIESFVFFCNVNRRDFFSVSFEIIKYT